MRVLMITSEWPSPETPHAVPFIVNEVENLRRTGVEVDIFHFRGRKNPFNYIRAWFQVQKILTHEQYDLIHAQWGQSALLAIPKKLPLVITFRGSDVEGIVDITGKYLWRGYFLSSFSYLVAVLADQAIVVSTKLQTRLPKRKYHVIPSGLDLEMFSPMNQVEARNSLGLPLDSKIVLFGGDPLRTEKRFPLAQSAVELAADNIPNLQFVVPQDVAHSLIPLHLNAADVMLLTSLYEGSPNIVKEALACNLPIVSTDVGDVRQRIGNNDGCVVCSDDRAETIALALKQVLARNKRIKGRETVLDLDERLLTQKVIAVYEMALSR